MSGVLIRPARVGDREGLALVWLDTATYYSRLDPERSQIPDADGLADWFEQHWSLPRPDNRFDRMADLDGQVVGLVAAFTEEPRDSASRQLVRELAWRRLEASRGV